MKRCNRLLCLTLSVSLLLGLLTGCGKKNADDNGTPATTQALTAQAAEVFPEPPGPAKTIYFV